MKREIKEELGVEAIFKSIIFFGEQANSRWGKQDFYFGCEIELLDENFTICQKELMGCKWWAFDEVKALKLTPITKIGIPFISWFVNIIIYAKLTQFLVHINWTQISCSLNNICL